MLAERREGLSTATIYSWMCSQELLKWFPLNRLEKEAAGSAPDTFQNRKTPKKQLNSSLRMSLINNRDAIWSGVIIEELKPITGVGGSEMNWEIWIDLCVRQSLSYVWLFATPWTIAHQALLSREFSRQEYWSGLPFPTPGDLPNPGIKPAYLASPTLAGRFFITVTWSRLHYYVQNR